MDALRSVAIPLLSMLRSYLTRMAATVMIWSLFCHSCVNGGWSQSSLGPSDGSRPTAPTLVPTR